MTETWKLEVYNGNSHKALIPALLAGTLKNGNMMDPQMRHF